MCIHKVHFLFSPHSATPHGHFVPQSNHKTARGMSSLKTKSFANRRTKNVHRSDATSLVIIISSYLHICVCVALLAMATHEI